jgi:SAM-dependent methyltransferase
MDADMPFDRRLRRLRRDRAAVAGADTDYLHRRASEEMLERLAMVRRTFSDALVVGALDGGLVAALRKLGTGTITADSSSALSRLTGGVECDEDRLPFANGSFDLVVAIGTLDTVNDLPGALTLMRRALRPDGLFLAAFAGAGSLPQLRRAMAAADEAEGGASPRIHPQIDLRAAGDLLNRAGFTLPVVDSETVEVRFPSLLRLVGDLRAMGGTNLLANRSRRPLTRFGLATAIANFEQASAADGKTSERFEILYLTAWSPSPDQPQPARRGSATASLAAALKTKA